MKGFVLFDLDNTLVDSLHLKSLRDKRDWPSVYRQIPTISLFEGINAMWNDLRVLEVFIGVVTHSPEPYARRVLDHVGLEPDKLIAYHHLNRRLKPSPFGYRLCARGYSPSDGIAIGDETRDLTAADAFGCRAVFAGWSRNLALNQAECESSEWIFAPNPALITDIVRSGMG